MINSASRFLFTLAFTFSTLTYLWVTASPANAQTQPSNPAPIAGMTCTPKPLTNGRRGETVMVCKPSAERRGVTVVVARLGR